MKRYPTIKKCVSGQPRIGILSQRNINSLVSRCSIYEFEDIIYEIDDADILSPAPRLLSNGIISRNIRRLAEKVTGVPKGPIVEEIQVQQDYDVFIACCLHIPDLRVLKNIKNWKQRSGKRVMGKCCGKVRRFAGGFSGIRLCCLEFVWKCSSFAESYWKAGFLSSFWS